MGTRVLLILPSYDSGGAENYALRLISHSKSDGIEWHVTSANLTNRIMDGAFCRAGASVHYRAAGYGNPITLRRFYSFLCRYKFQAIMSFNGIFAGPSMKLAQLAGIPIRIAWHRRSTPAYRQSGARRIYAGLTKTLLNSTSTDILSNSTLALENFVGTDWREDQRCVVIPNGVDGATFQPDAQARQEVRGQFGIRDKAVVFGHVGRVDPAKNHAILLRTFALIARQELNAHFVVAGTGTNDRDFKNLVDAEGIGDLVTTLGIRKDIHRFYNAMDCFVFPSLTEGQPNALIEAMLSGLPIAASNIPPIRETTPEWLHSHLFPPKDAKAASESAIHAIQTSEKTLDATRKWARNEFDSQRNFDLVIQRLKS